MNPFEFARKHLGEFRQRGSEIQPVYCPYCRGGQHHDKYTFALNVDKLTFNCARASCGMTGTFWKLCNDFGEVADSSKNFEISRPQKTYKPPQTKMQPAGQKVEEYLKKRGFSKETWEKYGVAESNGNIAFPYYEGGKLVLMKFRRPEKYTGEGQKAWREEGGKAVFWGMDLCKPDLPLVITEGEFDTLALAEAGVENVVSVPSGASDLTCVDNCWDWLQKFSRVIIWPDNDEPGQEMCRKLISRLGAWRCWVVISDYKDANEALFKEGPGRIWYDIETAKEVPIAGLVRLADVKPLDLENMVRVKSSINGINKVLGGYFMGQVSVWTGINSSGKSTLLGQELIAAVDQGFAVCAYSGELPAPLFRYWIELQAAGPDYLDSRYDSVKESEVYYPKAEVKELIREWYRDYFFFCDNFGSVKADNLLDLFEYAAKRYDCKVFLVDNLATTIFGEDKDNYYHKQGEFVGRLVDFAYKHDVHVHVVAHPRKTEGRLTKMDVKGSGQITDLAHNVLATHRQTDAEKKEQPCDTIVDIFKGRFYGKQDVEVELLFDDKSKRFCMPTDSQWFNKKYGWTSLLRGRQLC